MSLTHDLEIAVNSRLRDFIHLRGWMDLDDFSLRYSSQVADYVSRGYATEDACRRSLKTFKTQFFRLNRIQRDEFIKEFAPKIVHVGGRRELLDFILGFKAFAERQLVTPLRRLSDEETFRSFLQTHLQSNFLTYREVPSGAGRTDIFIVEPYKEIVEVKRWEGQQYFDDGLTELSTYLATEGLGRGFYVTVDFGQATEFLEREGREAWMTTRNGKKMHVVFVRIPTTAPSKLGQQSRKAARKPANGS